MSDSVWYIVKCRVGLSSIPLYRPVAGPSMMAFMLIYNRKHKASILIAFIMAFVVWPSASAFPPTWRPYPRSTSCPGRDPVSRPGRAPVCEPLAARVVRRPGRGVLAVPQRPSGRKPLVTRPVCPGKPRPRALVVDRRMRTEGRYMVVREREVGAYWGMNEVSDEFDPSIYDRWMWLS